MTDNLHDLIVAYIDVLIGRGLTPYTLAKACRMNTGSFSRFRSRKYSPTLRICNQIMQRLDLRLELYDCQGARVVASTGAKETVNSQGKTVDAGAAPGSTERVRNLLGDPSGESFDASEEEQR